MKIFLSLILMILPAFAIVSIKPRDIGESAAGFSGSVLLTLNNTRGNTETDTVDAGFSIQYDMNNSLVFLNSSYQYGESLGVKNIDKSFVHIRHIHKLSDHWDDELFMQQQDDAFQNLSSRTLAGAGIRFNGGDPKTSGRIYAGAGAFHVIEKVTDTDQENFDRGNFYLSYKYAPKKTFDFTLISYYQPRTDDSSDYLQFSTAQLQLKITDDFSFVLSINYNVDSKPAAGVKEYDYSQSTALKYKF